MVDSNPIGIVLTLYTLRGEVVDKVFSFDAPFHYLGPFEPMTIRSIKVGSRVALYANVINNVDGVNVEGYIHLRGGTYRYEKPIQLLTFHGDILSS